VCPSCQSRYKFDETKLGDRAKTIGEKLPKGFQRAEFVLEHGFVDQVVPRAQLRERVAYFLNAFRPSARDLRWSL